MIHLARPLSVKILLLFVLNLLACHLAFCATVVLIVDDNAVNRRVLNRTLTRGWPKADPALGKLLPVEEAPDGDKAIEWAHENYPKHKREGHRVVIFMDFSLPGIEGDETIRRIRSMFSDETLIIIGYSDGKIEGKLTPEAGLADSPNERMVKAGANAALPKPSGTPALFHTIKDQLAAKIGPDAQLHTKNDR